MIEYKRVKGKKELEKCMGIRAEVFQREQGIKPELDLDGMDKKRGTIHFLATEDGEPIGTVRMTPDGKIGRTSVLGEHRGRGVAKELMRQIMEAAKKRDLTRVFCHAQKEAEGFYEKLGFRREGDEFAEAGKRHVKMVLKLTDSKEYGEGQITRIEKEREGAFPNMPTLHQMFPCTVTFADGRKERMLFKQVERKKGKERIAETWKATLDELREKGLPTPEAFVIDLEKKPSKAGASLLLLRLEPEDVIISSFKPGTKPLNLFKHVDANKAAELGEHLAIMHMADFPADFGDFWGARLKNGRVVEHFILGSTSLKKENRAENLEERILFSLRKHVDSLRLDAAKKVFLAAYKSKILGAAVPRLPIQRYIAEKMRELGEQK